MDRRQDLWDIGGRGDVASLDDPLAGCLARLTAEEQPLTTLDLLPDAYVRTDTDGAVVVLNLAARRLWERETAEPECTLHELVARDHRERVRTVLRNVDDVVRGIPAVDLAAPATGAARVRVVRTDDGMVHWLLRRLMIDDDDPTSLLRRKLSDWLPGVSYVATPDPLWSPVVVGDGLRSLLGLDPDAWNDDPEIWIRSIHQADRTRVMGARAACVEQGGDYEAHYRLRTHQGVRWVRDLAKVVETSSGDRLVVGVVFDVTSEHRAHQVLEELYDAAQDRIDRLRREAEARDTLLRLFGHDVRSPLKSALTVLDRLLGDGGPETGQAGRLLEALRDMLGRMQRLVDEVLDEDRLLRGRPLQFGMADLSDVTAEALEEFPEARERILLEARPVVARVDRTLIVRLIHNLVRNALDYTDDEFPILVRVAPRDASVVVAVEDHGPGIPEDVRERITEPFVRGNEEGRDGLGLGLTLVRQIVDLHGGTLRLEDLDGKGLAVRVELPYDGGERAGARPGDPVVTG